MTPATVTDIRRRDVGVIRRRSYWETRLEDAATPKDAAVASWDGLRARINRLPVEQAETYWRQVVAALNGLAPDMGQPRAREAS